MANTNPDFSEADAIFQQLGLDIDEQSINVNRKDPDFTILQTDDITTPIETIDQSRPNYSDATTEKDNTTDSDVVRLATTETAQYALRQAGIDEYTELTSLPNTGTNLVPTYFGGKNGQA